MKRKKIKSSWTDYFNFSSRERRGAVFLACILGIQIIILFYQRNREKAFPLPDPGIISSFFESVNKEVADSLIYEKTDLKTEKKLSLFGFDPNFIDETSGQKLGLSIKQISVINNYLSHGGKFRIKNDFKKMYCISKSEYNELESYILLPDSFIKKVPEHKKSQIEYIKVNIEDADSITLEKLKGIGPVLASRIIRYREKLGGFCSLEQLKEVWGINDTLYQSLFPFIIIDNSIPFRFIHLNTDTFEILASHPYIKGKLAGLICNYRKQHKTFSSIGELKNLPLITEENFLKLAPYLMPD